MLGSVLFHLGILAIFAGHFVGLLTPIAVWDALGVTHGAKQMLAIVAGGLAGAMIGSSAELLSNLLPLQLTVKGLIVTVIDGHPATLSWLGSVHGHKVAGLGAEHFGQTGTVNDLYRHFGLTVDAITPQILARLGA